MHVNPKVLHLSTYDNHGGAARAAYSLHRAMVDQGIDSSMFVGLRGSSDSSVTAAARVRFRSSQWADHQLWRLQRTHLSTWRSPARFGSLSAAEINRSDANIVNLHWITDGFLSIEEIGKIKKPIVWSMYDMWPFTGTEHYVPDHWIPRWKTGYPPSSRSGDDSGLDLDRWTFLRKVRNWDDLHTRTILVPASTWLAEGAATSALMGTWNMQRIPHTVESLFFSPIKQSVAKNNIGLSQRHPIILFVSSGGISDERKGWDLFKRALPKVTSEYKGLTVVIVGPEPSNETKRHLDASTTAQMVWFGNATSSEALRLLYSTADVTVVPSRQDNLPLVAMEAQACGCPVVGFDIGGLPEIVLDKVTGRIAEPLSTDDLGQSLIEALETKQRSASRLRAQEIWHPQVVVQKYLTLYEEYA